MKTYCQFILLLFANAITSFGQVGTENLKVNWPEEYKWKAVSETNDSSLHTTVGILEKDSGEYKNLKGTSLVYKNVNKVPLSMAMSMMYDQLKADAPKAIATPLERDDKAKHPWILFLIEIPRFKNDKTPESRLYYIVQGEHNLFTHFIATKEKRLSPEFVQEWSNVFKESKME